MRFYSIPLRRIALLSVLLLLAATSAFGREAEYDIAVETDVMVPMRDGVRLATDIYRPAKDGEPLEGRLPTILTRLPYNKDGQKGTGRYFAARGYVFVAQDTRGRYKSEGVWHMLTDDGPDGHDTAEWIIAQPWSDGKFGMMGTSYVGGTQHAMAMVKPPGLATIIPVDAMSNLGYQSMRNAGAFELRFWNWIMLNAGRGSRQARDPGTAAVLKEMADERKNYLANLPLRPGMTPLRLASEYEEWLVEGMRRGANGEFWTMNAIIDYPELYKDIPVYLVGGWYDSWGGNTTANYMVLSKTIQGPVYLIMGPWIHGAQSRSAHGQVSFGENAAIPDHLGWRLQWFDRWLKGDESVVGREAPFAAPVRIFVMGTGDGRKTDDGKLNHGGFWRDEQEWPLARTRYTGFHLQPGGGLAGSVPAAENASTSFQFDPKDPVPTIGGCISSGNDILLQGAWDQRGGEHVWNFQEPIPLSARNDVLVFQSEPLEADVEVTGEITVKLWISSSAPDTDFTAKLIDVYPSSADFPGGFDLLIGDGIVRARFRESLTEEKLMEPGKVYPVTIKLYPTSNVFKKGHRIRVDISSSNFPRFDLNPNTGEPLNENRRVQTAVNTVYHDRERPSHILLPVIP
ncbi:MAG: CocE/NonD family hydrolase [Thermoguttaceae bacterium]|jgi:putative CocE/NonD family hydrolase|nr:CocE/NonD family hydrolase [Thermoguttaceae bacterium]